MDWAAFTFRNLSKAHGDYKTNQPRIQTENNSSNLSDFNALETASLVQVNYSTKGDRSTHVVAFFPQRAIAYFITCIAAELVYDNSIGERPIGVQRIERQMPSQKMDEIFGTSKIPPTTFTQGQMVNSSRLCAKTKMRRVLVREPSRLPQSGRPATSYGPIQRRLCKPLPYHHNKELIALNHSTANSSTIQVENQELNLSSGSRQRGWLKLRFNDCAKGDPMEIGIPLENWDAMASDRVVWKTAVRDGSKKIDSDYL
eukprot:gene659-10365_t